MQDVWINGNKASHIQANDRGLCYGDGLFETVAVTNGCPELLDAHLQRLELGLNRLAFPSNAINLVKADLAKLELSGEAVLKITVTRGTGLRGYAPSSDASITRIIILSRPGTATDKSENGVSVRLCDYRLPLNPALAQIKHLNRLDQVMARSEWDDPGISDGIVLDTDGFIVEGTMSNVFWITKGTVNTPLIDRCGVKGVMRDHLLAIAQGEELECLQGRYELSVLEEADEAFICNSLIGIWPIVRFNNHAFKIGPITRKLQQLLSRK